MTDAIDEHLARSAAKRVLAVAVPQEMSEAVRAALTERVAAELRTLLRTRDEWGAGCRG